MRQAIDDVPLLAEREQLADRQPAQRHPEEEQEDEPQDEGRRADHADREGAQDVVQPAVLVDRRQHAKRDADRDREEGRRGRQKQARAHPRGDLVHDGTSTLDGVAEISVDHAAQPHEVADPDRLVEAQVVADLGQLRVGHPRQDLRIQVRVMHPEGEA